MTWGGGLSGSQKNAFFIKEMLNRLETNYQEFLQNLSLQLLRVMIFILCICVFFQKKTLELYRTSPFKGVCAVPPHKLTVRKLLYLEEFLELVIDILGKFVHYAHFRILQ